MKTTLYLLLAVIVLLPWYVVRGTIAGIPVTALEITIAVLAVVWLFEDRWYLRTVGAVQDVWTDHRAILLGTTLFVVSAALSLTISPDLRHGLGQLKAYILEPVLVMIIAIRVVRAKPWAWTWLAAALAVAAIEVSLLSISQLIWAWPNLAPAELAQGRMSSFYNTANAVGLFVGPLVLMSLAMIGIRELPLRLRMLFGIAGVLGPVAIILSRSGGAMLAVLISGLVGLVLLFVRRLAGMGRRFSWLVVAGLGLYVLASVIFVWWYNAPPHVANPYTRPGFDTFTVRQCLWEGTNGLLEDSPLLGAGLAGFPQTYQSYATCDAEPLVYPHMLVLNFWTETGLLGLLGMILITGIWLQRAGEAIFSQGSAWWAGLAIFLPMVYWLVHGLVDVPYFKNDLAVEWWLLFALAVTCGYAWTSLTRSSRFG